MAQYAEELRALVRCEIGAGTGLREIARTAEIDAGSLSKFLSGERSGLSHDALERLAAACGCEIWVVREHDPKDEKVRTVCVRPAKRTR